MRVSINQGRLTLEIEKFLKRLKKERTKWDGFYSQLTNLLLGFDDIYDPDEEYIGYLQFFVILRYDLQRIDSDYFDLMDELKIIGYREMRKWFLDLFELFKKDYETIENRKMKIKLNCRNIAGQYLINTVEY